MERKTLRLIWAARIFVVIFYAVGLVGLLYFRELFRQLVPLSLVLTATILFIFHYPWSRAYQLFAAGLVVAGWLVEWIGVRTGVIFGFYRYGSDFGITLDGVPILIGVNWLMLTYCCGILVQTLNIRPPWRALSGAALMVGMDLLLEPVAMALGWWQWQTGTPPLQNFVAWFYLSFLFLLAMFSIPHRPVNPLAVWILLAHASFFAALQLFSSG